MADSMRQADITQVEPHTNASHTPKNRRRCYRSRWERQLGECDSPIESDFLSALCPVVIEFGYHVARSDDGTEEAIVVIPQANIDRHRVDFLIRFAFFGAELQIVVETDGHDWHERTKAQARRDRQRDRDLQAIGYEVFRFTGAEIRQSAKACAGEVLDAITTFQTQQVERHAPQPWGY